MTRNVYLLLVCTAIFLSLMLVTAGAEGEELPGLDVYVIGQHAYVAAGSRGLYVVDISRPANLKRVASLGTPGETHGIYQLYDLLIVADGSRGLQLIDIRNPKSLNIVAAYETPGETRNVHGLASTVYAAGQGFGLGIFDVIDRSRLDPNGHFLVHPDR
jgi:hypothetical protein